MPKVFEDEVDVESVESAVQVLRVDPEVVRAALASRDPKVLQALLEKFEELIEARERMDTDTDQAVALRRRLQPAS